MCVIWFRGLTIIALIFKSLNNFCFKSLHFFQPFIDKFSDLNKWICKCGFGIIFQPHILINKNYNFKCVVDGKFVDILFSL